MREDRQQRRRRCRRNLQTDAFQHGAQRRETFVDLAHAEKLFSGAAFEIRRFVRRRAGGGFEKRVSGLIAAPGIGERSAQLRLQPSHLR